MALEVTNLTVTIGGKRVVDDVSFRVAQGSRLGIIGESGSGKSMTVLSLLGLQPRGAQVSGSVLWNGRELVGLSPRELAAVRGKEIGFVFQEPTTALDPIRKVGSQIGEALRIHYDLSRAEVRERSIEMARRMQLPDPANIVERYPHELSGGQRQRVAIAMALATGPRLIIADEPTTALDVTVQAGILTLFDELVASSGSSLIFVTHDIALLSQLGGAAMVMAHGRVVEAGALEQLIARPEADFTRELISAARATSWTADEAES